MYIKKNSPRSRIRGRSKEVLPEAMRGADVIGLSGKGLLKAEHVASMAPRGIVFAMANPDPEILPDEAERAGARGCRDRPFRFSESRLITHSSSQASSAVRSIKALPKLPKRPSSRRSRARGASQEADSRKNYSRPSRPARSQGRCARCANHMQEKQTAKRTGLYHALVVLPDRLYPFKTEVQGGGYAAFVHMTPFLRSINRNTALDATVISSGISTALPSRGLHTFLNQRGLSLAVSP